MSKDIVALTENASILPDGKPIARQEATKFMIVWVQQIGYQPCTGRNYLGLKVEWDYYF